MKFSDIFRLRLYNQQVAFQKSTEPAELMKWLCGMQAQDYLSAKSALGIRLPGITDAKIEESIASRQIVRTWPMRGTLHFVAGEDIHWILDLLAPARIRANQFRNKQLNLDAKLLNRSKKILEKVLEGGNHLTREEINMALIERGIKADNIQLAHIIQNAGLEKILCFGIRSGNKFTYTLLDEWIPQKKSFNRDEALNELAVRYFLSRGPALLKDFVWWSGLKMSDARRAVQSAGKNIKKEIIKGNEYFMGKEEISLPKSPRVYLLPSFDEYLISYSDRSPSLDPLYKERMIFSNGIFNPIIVIKGIVLGVWKRIVRNKDILVELRPFLPLKSADYSGIKKELLRYRAFFQKPLVVKDDSQGGSFHLHIE